MTLSAERQAELTDLLDALCDGTIVPEQAARLQQLLLHNGDAQWFYLRHIHLHGTLLWDRQSRSEWNAVQQLKGRGLPPPSSVDGEAPVVSPRVSAASPPNLTFLPSTVQGTLGYFSSGWPVAYLVATVILGIGLAIGAVTHVSRPEQVVRDFPALHSPLSTRHSVVGRITGTVDCRWSDGGVEAVPGAPVVLGQKYALASGQVQITYDSGAIVILQGPVSYEVESTRGGFLSVGKLTARVERKVASGQWPLASKSETSNPQSPIPNPSLATNHWPLFTVRTPTAIVTDLGTEFGVEVSKNGSTVSHVFRGSVRLQAAGPRAETEGNAVTLHENESARVTTVEGAAGHQKYVIAVGASVTPTDFVRQLARPAMKVLDLVDVVAGGDGFSGRRNRGIDLRNGRLVDTLSVETYFGDRKYHPVKETPLVDGVFIISTGSYDDPVQLDSAGHTVTGLSAGETQSRGHVWAGGHDGVFSILGGVDYSTPGHGMIALHANSGVTFDLAAIRRANPGWKLLRFRSTAGLAEPTRSEHGTRPHGNKLAEYEPDGLADLRVFVDGEVRFQRREVNVHTGALRAVVPIKDGDRFLTLVATHANNGITGDYTMFGDLQLELAPTATAAESTR